MSNTKVLSGDAVIKKIKIQPFMVGLLVAFCSCTTVNRIHFTELKNDIVMKDSWNKFITNRPNPKIVLRVPGYSKDVTQAEMSQYESFYTFIEKDYLWPISPSAGTGPC